MQRFARNNSPPFPAGFPEYQAAGMEISVGIV